MAQAWIGVLLRLEYPMNKEWVKMFPLADYAAKHFIDQAEFGDVMSRIKDGITSLASAMGAVTAISYEFHYTYSLSK